MTLDRFSLKWHLQILALVYLAVLGPVHVMQIVTAMGFDGAFILIPCGIAVCTGLVPLSTVILLRLRAAARTGGSL